MFFKVIISPEFGDKLDLEAITKETMARVELEYGRLDWMAVQHHNTDNPHVHVLVRGTTLDGHELRFTPDFVKHGFRQHAEIVCTNHLGYRSEQNIVEAQQREIRQARFTGLDRKLLSKAAVLDSGLLVRVGAHRKHFSSIPVMTDMNLRARLKHLEQMGLADHRAGDKWMLDPSFEQSLRAMQRTVDRQKMMLAHGLVSSDKDLGFRVLKTSDIQEVEGRILVHGQEEQGNGIRNFMMVESIQGEIVQIPQTKEIAKARKHGNLEPGAYVMIKRTSADDDPAEFSVQEEGDADGVSHKTEFIAARADRILSGVPEYCGGWLGKMRSAALEAVRAKNTQSRAAVSFSR